MARNRKSNLSAHAPTQRQLRAGELVRHALVEILAREEFRDPALQGVAITIGEVRSSPDLRHANIFCSALGKSGKEEMDAIAEALNRASGFLRGRLGREIDMKFTPQLHFIADLSYDEAADMNEVFRRADVARDLDPEED
ncbi:MAG: 30S ribosome-binding factor RbfA [Hyphomonadaceae bacterium]|nr:30S ribosome-binding factor RbfA [Hyphomonadaceae bacterium]